MFLHIIPKEMGKMLTSGMSVYRLEILEMVEKRGARKFWKCKCECGKEKIIEEGSITRSKNPTRSCGCLQKEAVADAVRLPDGESTFKQVLNTYKHSAKSRKHEFNLSESEFKFLTKQNCFYCDSKPKNVARGFGGFDYVYNGIDRMNNKLGYFRENCVSCCSTCNKAKLQMSFDEFINWIDTVHVVVHGRLDKK